MSSRPKPLVTVLLLGYNHEKYIREGMEAILAQTYAPLEIIASDDGSSDRTAEIMASVAGHYRGDKKIILNRNPKPNGIGGHIDILMKMASGELIVAAASDDVSMPERVAELCEAWESSDRKATSIYSEYTIIDGGGKIAPPAGAAPNYTGATIERPGTLQGFLKTMQPVVWGCAHAWSPKLFSFFGPLTRDTNYEDVALSFRSLAIGKILRIDKPLIYYRRHDANMSASADNPPVNDPRQIDVYDRLEETHIKRSIGIYQGFQRDIEVLFGRRSLDETQSADLSRLVKEKLGFFEARLKMMNGDLRERMTACSTVIASDAPLQLKLKDALRVLPRPLYKHAWLMKNRLGSLFHA